MYSHRWSKYRDQIVKQSSLMVDFYELTMASAYYRFKPSAKATFDLFVRKLPKNRSFLVACGIEDALSYLKNLSFSKDDIQYLKRFNLPAGFLKFLSKLMFTGDVWAVKDGTVIFAGEPILRITAPLIEAQLVESYLLNNINVQTAVASKAVRVVMSAQTRPVFDFSLRRTQGLEAGLKAARASYIAGCAGTSTVLAGKLFDIKVVGTMAHSYIMSFGNELESFQAYAQVFPGESILLLDTYSYDQGIKNAITVANELKEKGYKLLGVRLDSGNLLRESKKIRTLLNKNGLSFVKIFASGNLDEFKIEKLLQKGAPIDSFGVGTNMGVSVDAPYCDVIYKISEVTDKSGFFSPTMKLSRGKSTIPGRKQIFRINDRKGKMSGDILALEREKIKGNPLLKKMMGNGRKLYPECTLKSTREFVAKQLKNIPDQYKKLKPVKVYPVKRSRGLEKLMQDVSKQIKQT
ncbi:MAG: nicotinate phosphoribosyltransferase [Candidatus Omnitrophota bacterium]